MTSAGTAPAMETPANVYPGLLFDLGNKIQIQILCFYGVCD
jgi:hypothetical protein